MLQAHLLLSAINLICFEFQYIENFMENWKLLTPSDASIKIITPSHSLKAAVISSEKLTCPAEKQILKEQREQNGLVNQYKLKGFS